MDLSSYLHEAIFEEKDKYTYLYELIWDNFEEDGFAVTDEEGHEVDAVFKAIAIKNLINEFVYRMYDEANETDFQEIITNLANLGIGDEAAIDYCYENPEIDTDDEDDGLTIKMRLTTQPKSLRTSCLSFSRQTICSTISLPQHTIFSRISHLPLRMWTNFRHLLIQTPTDLTNTKRNTPLS